MSSVSPTAPPDDVYHRRGVCDPAPVLTMTTATFRIGQTVWQFVPATERIGLTEVSLVVLTSELVWDAILVSFGPAWRATGLVRARKAPFDRHPPAYSEKPIG